MPEDIRSKEQNTAQSSWVSWPISIAILFMSGLSSLSSMAGKSETIIASVRNMTDSMEPRSAWADVELDVLYTYIFVASLCFVLLKGTTSYRKMKKGAEHFRPANSSQLSTATAVVADAGIDDIENQIQPASNPSLASARMSGDLLGEEHDGSPAVPVQQPLLAKQEAFNSVLTGMAKDIRYAKFKNFSGLLRDTTINLGFTDSDINKIVKELDELCEKYSDNIENILNPKTFLTWFLNLFSKLSFAFSITPALICEFFISFASITILIKGFFDQLGGSFPAYGFIFGPLAGLIVVLLSLATIIDSSLAAQNLLVLDRLRPPSQQTWDKSVFLLLKKILNYLIASFSSVGALMGDMILILNGVQLLVDLGLSEESSEVVYYGMLTCAVIGVTWRKFIGSFSYLMAGSSEYQAPNLFAFPEKSSLLKNMMKTIGISLPVMASIMGTLKSSMAFIPYNSLRYAFTALVAICSTLTTIANNRPPVQARELEQQQINALFLAFCEKIAKLYAEKNEEKLSEPEVLTALLASVQKFVEGESAKKAKLEYQLVDAQKNEKPSEIEYLQHELKSYKLPEAGAFSKLSFFRAAESGSVSNKTPAKAFNVCVIL